MHDVIIILIALLIAAIFLLICFGPSIWISIDASKRGGMSLPLAILLFLAGPMAVFIWLAVRPKKADANRAPWEYKDPESALRAAARLDHKGDWESAFDLYAFVIRRWPNHRDYAISCIQDIQSRQLLAEQNEDIG